MTTTTSETIPKREAASPIPAPTNELQYRAIGLLHGRYVPRDEITQGILLTTDGTVIEAAVLGKLLGLLKSVKVGIDLNKEHLWVVYPRTKDRGEKSADESGNPPDTTQEPTSKSESPASPSELSEEPKADSEPSLHVQMAGIWEPETLHPDSPAPVLEQKPDYFSIQGEVVFQQNEEGWVMVKILQKPRAGADKPTYFKLKLSGVLPEKAVKNFWKLDVEREGNSLVVRNSERIAYLGKPKKKPQKGQPTKGKPIKEKPIKRSDAGQQPVKAVASPKELPKLKKKQPNSGS